jgi:serpin B
MMWQISPCRYGLADKVQILEKTYRGRDLAMMILLPEAQPEALTDLEHLLSTEKVKEWSLRLSEQMVKLYLPRFKLETSLDLGESLATMGMAKVFQSDQANLSGIDGGKMPLWLGRVLHRALVCVDEEGTKAVAATAGMGTFGGPPPVRVFCADHPFVFLIRDTRSGNILFIGRLMMPDPAPPGMPKRSTPDANRAGAGMF